MEARDALNAQRGGAHTFDLGAHFYQELGEIGDLRFERGVFEDGFALGQNRSGQNILRAGDRDFRKAESGAAQAFRPGFHIAMFDGNLRAEFFEGLNVDVDWTRSDGATARQGNSCVTESREQWPQSQDRSAHRFYQLVGSFLQ